MIGRKKKSGHTNWERIVLAWASESAILWGCIIMTENVLYRKYVYDDRNKLQYLCLWPNNAPEVSENVHERHIHFAIVAR